MKTFTLRDNIFNWNYVSRLELFPSYDGKNAACIRVHVTCRNQSIDVVYLSLEEAQFDMDRVKSN